MSARTIGIYELEGLLGEGGIGQVYAAHDTVLGRKVAIKTLRPELSGDQNFVERFYVEAKSLGNLNHPNITTIYALHAEGAEACIVMELVHGYTLEALLARVHRLSLRDSLAILAQAVAGMRYAHRKGVIHRDLKPANLMVTDDGVVKIMDFGVARVRGSQHLTRVGEFCGTFVYASPEQIRGEEVDERSDLYSLAIVLYRMLGGTAPFTATNEYALMTAQLQTPPPPLIGRVPDLDAATEQVLMRALAKRAEDRFSSVEEFGRAIGAAALSGESVEILTQLYARAFAQQDLEATRIVASRPSAPAGDPTMPSNRREWQLPPSGPGLARPPSSGAAPGSSAALMSNRMARRSVLSATPAAAAERAGSTAPPGKTPLPEKPRPGWRAWLVGLGVLALPALFGGGYYLANPDAVTPLLPAAWLQADRPAAVPQPPLQAVPRAEPVPPPVSPAPVEPAKTEPEPLPVPPAAVEPVQAERLTPAPIPPALLEAGPLEAGPLEAGPLEAGPEEPPPPSLPAVAAARPVQVEPDPPLPVPPTPVAPAKTDPVPVVTPSQPVQAQPAAPLPPSPERATAAVAPPAPAREAARQTAAVEPARREPPPEPVRKPEPQPQLKPEPQAQHKPEPQAVPPEPKAAEPDPVAEPRSGAVQVAVAAAPSQAAATAPAPTEQQAPLGPQPVAIPPQPEGEPDLQGRVGGAKRLDEIEVAGRWIKIYGIVDRARGGAQEAKQVQVLLRYLQPARNVLVCYQKGGDAYRCYADGQDIAKLALLDGAVQLAPDAPPEYRALRAQKR